MAWTIGYPIFQGGIQMKNEVEKSSKRWNLFARELEDILEEHGLRLGHLNDRAGLHPQKVSRL
jgi:hypothetical protein